MFPQDDPAFSIPTWRTVLDQIKVYTTARIQELKSQLDGDQEAIAKILACENWIKDTKCWKQYSGKEKKVFCEFSYPF